MKTNIKILLGGFVFSLVITTLSSSAVAQTFGGGGSSGCKKVVVSDGEYYECDGNKITPTAKYFFGESIKDFTNPSGSRDGRAHWNLYRYQSSYAIDKYQYSCLDNGNVVYIADADSYVKQYITNFSVSGDKATWQYYSNGLFNGASSQSRTLSTCTCTDSTWTPSTSNYCSGIIFTQTSNCGNTRTATGTSTTGSCCTDTTWNPPRGNYCLGQSFIQTSNCGRTRWATGTSTTGVCCIDTTWNSPQNPSSVCKGTYITQTSNCGRTRTVEGTMNCSVPTFDFYPSSTSGGGSPALTSLSTNLNNSGQASFYLKWGNIQDATYCWGWASSGSSVEPTSLWPLSGTFKGLSLPLYSDYVTANSSGIYTFNLKCGNSGSGLESTKSVAVDVGACIPSYNNFVCENIPNGNTCPSPCENTASEIITGNPACHAFNSCTGSRDYSLGLTECTSRGVSCPTAERQNCPACPADDVNAGVYIEVAP